MCYRFGCVEPLPIFLATEPFPSRFSICDVSPASDFDIWFYVTFVHLDMSFTCLSITWMIFSTFASQTISCALMLSTHPSRGRYCWNQVDMSLDLIVMSVWQNCWNEFVSFMRLFASLLLCASWWVLWALYVSFALVSDVLSFYLFLRSRLLYRAFNLHMISVKPFLPFLEGSCVVSQLYRAFALVFGNWDFSPCSIFY